MASVTPRTNSATIRADLKGFCAALDMSIETWQLDVYRAISQGRSIEPPKGRKRG